MDWLEEELGNYEDDYLIFDCPGRSSLRSEASEVSKLRIRQARLNSTPIIHSFPPLSDIYRDWVYEHAARTS